jgi:hypothetical protein
MTVSSLTYVDSSEGIVVEGDGLVGYSCWPCRARCHRRNCRWSVLRESMWCRGLTDRRWVIYMVAAMEE